MDKSDREALIEKAREQYGSDDIEIDDGAKTSTAKDMLGSWVQAWVWVSNDEDQ